VAWATAGMTRRRRTLIANAAIGGALLVAASLLVFPPTEVSMYPRCPIYTYLHLLCPGCGTTRAMAALLRGQVVEALHWNAVTTLLLPLAVIFFGKSYARAVRDEKFAWPEVTATWLTVVLVIAAGFTVGRNVV
jgi:Protein of unknown function (DUF2752)